MKKTHSDYVNSFQQRNQLKDLKGHIYNFLLNGTNCSQLESEAIATEIKSIISLFVPDFISPGKLAYSAVKIDEGAGTPLKACEKGVVYLTLIKPDNDKISKGTKYIRQLRINRMCEEAFIQGCLLTEEDLSLIMSVDVRTIRRDVKELRDKGEIIMLRGYVRDIGRTISHKVQIILKYIKGTEIVDLIRETKHSLESIERYLNAFGRIVFLYNKRLPVDEISFITKTSQTLAKEYIKIYTDIKETGNEFELNRIKELSGEMYKKKLKQARKEK